MTRADLLLEATIQIRDRHPAWRWLDCHTAAFPLVDAIIPPPTNQHPTEEPCSLS